MNPMNNMAGFNPGSAALGNMQMVNGAGGRMAEDPADDNTNMEPKLNSYIYGYLCTTGQYDAARALKNSGARFEPPFENDDSNGDGNMPADSKDGIDFDRPKDLPNIKNLANDGQGGSFLLSWFSLFWDIYFAHRKDPRSSSHASLYVQHTQQQVKMRQDQQQQMIQRIPMMPNGAMDPNFQMMRFQGGMNPENLRQRAAMQNTNRNGIQATPQQIAQMQRQQMMQHQAQQQTMRRDGEMEMNGQRPRTPSASDHAPSPSKRPRLDGVQFNGQQMMPNGRGPPPGMPGQMIGGPGAVSANQLLEMNGINPGNLSDSQFASFQQQNPQVQQKSIQVYAQNLAKGQRQQSMSNAGGNMEDHGSPSFPPGLDVGLGNEFYNGQNPAAMQMRGAPPPNGANGGVGGNHALQDYQMQLMLLEQQNKKRLLMARQEQDTIGGNGRPNDGSGMPQGPFAPGMSPSGSRGGPSPGPGDRKGGTPKMNQVGLPGSPMPDGSMRGSPAAMNFNQMNPELYAQMNGNGMRPPPSSHPGGYPNGQFNQGQMEAMGRQQASQRVQTNGWQGPQGGQVPMMQQPQPQQPPQMGTPQQRNEMPPPQAVPGATTNGRPGSPPVQPSPQPASKANPKGKKDTRDRKKPAKKGSTASVAATPASEAENAPPTPTPATPVTPQHQASFAPKNDGQAQPNMMAGMASNAPDALAEPQSDANAMQLANFGAEGDYNLGFTNDLNNGDLLENFDFEQFLQSTDDTGFSFDGAAFDNPDGIEAGLGGS